MGKVHRPMREREVVVGEEMEIDINSDAEEAWDEPEALRLWNEFSVEAERDIEGRVLGVSQVRVEEGQEPEDERVEEERAQEGSEEVEVAHGVDEGVSQKKVQQFLLGAVPLKTKKEAGEAVMQRVKLLQSLGLAVKRLHSDRGSEFLQKHVVRFLATEGIRQTTSTGGVGASRENGRAEQAISTITGKVRTLLHSGKVDKAEWSHALRMLDHLMMKAQLPVKDLIPAGMAFGDRVVTKFFQTSVAVKDQFGGKNVKVGQYLGVYDKQSVPGGVVLLDTGEIVRSDTIRRLTNSQVEALKGDGCRVSETRMESMFLFQRSPAVRPG